MTNLKRNDGSTKLQVGEYWPGTRAVYWYVWRCPKCERTANISKDVHTVLWDGTVEPAVKCPNAACYFQDEYFLEDWVPESKGEA